MPTARHALCPVVRVRADERPPAQPPGETVYAVFTPDDDPAGAGRFLGLVTPGQTAAYRERIFADLLPRPAPAAVAAHAPLNDVVTHLDREKAEAVAVLEAGGAFLGAVTRASLLGALLQGAPKPGVAAAPVENLHAASLHLFSLLALHEVEQDLLQLALEALTSLLKVRYGAIGIVNEHGRLVRFVHTGIAPELAARIGRLPEGKGLLGVVIAENHALRLDDMSQDPRAAGFPPHHPPMKSLLAVPVSRDGRVYGRLYFSDRLDGAPFSDEDERLAAQAADVLGLTLSHHRLQNERRQATDTLHDIARVLSANTGAPLFHKLVLSLAKVLGVDYAFVGKVSPHHAGIIQTLAFCDHGNIVDNIEYQLVPATVCGSVGGKTTCYFPEGVGKLYPEDEILREFQVEAFVGQPLLDASGRVLGLLAIMHGRPLPNPGQVQSILQISAARATAELERITADAEWRKLSSAIEQTDDSVAITDADGVIEYVNPAYERHTGYRREEALGKKPNISKSGKHDAAFYAELWRTIKRGGVFHGRFINRRKDGSLYHEEKTITPLKDDNGQITHFVSTGKDITEHVRAENQVTRLGRILDDSSNEIYVFDAGSLRFVQANQGARRNLGYTMDELKQLTPLDLKPEFNRETFEALIAPLRRDEKERINFTTVHRRKNGGDYPVEVQLQLMRHEIPPVFVAIIQDITERRQTEERLSFLAYHDMLTGLPNRVLLLERLKQALLDANRVNRLVAVMFLDLDRFKVINDSLGHHVGDALLKAVAERLKSCLRPGDIIARLGGDEFTVVLANVAHVDDVARVARKIVDSFAEPFRIEDHELFTTTSIGITLFPLDVQEPEKLLKNADAAMYHAKESGRNSFKFFTAELNVRAERRLKLETALRRALEQGELSLHYQPQVNLRSGRLVGMEALLRWQNPELGNVSPVEFIPIAEETGLILPIGDWVLHEACRQIKVWHATKFSFSKMQVAVNISGKQLRQKDFPDRVRGVLSEANLEPRYLDLELTESLLMVDAEETGDIMHVLHDLGVSFSVDDFGTGYSSLAYLKRFPIDILKIDQSFVRDLATDPNDVAIVKTIIAMAHTLGMRVIAEGVETYAQLEFLRRQGCDGSQGYYCSKPLTADDFTELLADWERIRQGRCRADTTGKRRRAKPRTGRPRPAALASVPSAKPRKTRRKLKK